MWIVIPRVPRPDAPYWTGRRTLAVIDAVGWPAGWIAWASTWPESAGLVGQVVLPVAVTVALARSHTALVRNHRYRFTTWRWARALATLVAAALILKVAVLFG
jgi:hypothetical protein